MRVGFNPNKDKNLVRSDYYHKIIIPVYIPNFEGYFKDSFRIFKICLESLYKLNGLPHDDNNIRPNSSDAFIFISYLFMLLIRVG